LPADYWNDPAGFFERQAQVSLASASDLLAKYPPGIGASVERRGALTILDQLLHDEEAGRRPAVQEFFHARIRQALGQIKTTRVLQGATLWKLYDHAFVLRTSTVTLAFDLTRAGSAGVEGFVVAEKIIRELVEQCDVLFVSHLHKDHADEEVARLFLAQGKPVIAPVGVWAGREFHPKVTHLRRESGSIQTLALRAGRPELKVTVFPGHQRVVENNVVLVTTAEGLRICHTGDQNEPKDHGWIDQIGAAQETDILLVNCWSPDLARLIRGSKARIVIPGHENELGHVVLHREPYWLTADRLTAFEPVNAVFMTWGEKFSYERAPNAR
jgi:L-ascorbate metabolism protein UlaG (beta-lactamase superfamily)